MSIDETAEDVVYCARHPHTETRLSCTQCGTPICPSCMVASPVGQKCPDCARLPKTARASVRPGQLRGALLQGGAVAIASAFGLGLIVFRTGFLSLIASGVVGWWIAEAVRRGAQGNRNDVLRYLAFGLAVAAVVGGWVVVGAQTGRDLAQTFDLVTRGPFRLLTLPVAVYGAWRSTG